MEPRVNKVLLSSLIILLSATNSYHSPIVPTPWVYQDFDVSMKTSLYPKELEHTFRRVGVDGHKLHDFFKSLYDTYNLSILSADSLPKIPKIIHWIWIGGPIPEMFQQFIESCKALHPGWLFFVWDDASIEQLSMYNRSFYDSVNNPGIRADLARLEILYQFGGFYLDTDVEVLRSLEPLLVYDFVIGIQPMDSGFLQLANGIIGCIPGHPVIKHARDTIKDDWHHSDIPTKTGPIHLTRSFVVHAGRNGNKDIALPATYCYPLACHAKTIERDRWINEGAFDIHWWSKTWLPASHRPQQFRGIDAQGVN